MRYPAGAAGARTETGREPAVVPRPVCVAVGAPSMPEQLLGLSPVRAGIRKKEEGMADERLQV